jgi:protease PrsW
MSFTPPPTAVPPPAGARPYPHRVRRQRRGVLATVLGLVALGFCGLTLFNLLVLQVGGAGVVVGALCALLPVGPVVAAFLWLDRWEPEPPRLLLFAFLWGACFAALAALILNSSAEAAGAAVLGIDASKVFSSIFVAPWVEEAMKGAFVLGLLLFRRREFDGILDGVVYAGVVAAGFAFTENILYLGTAFSDGAQGGGVLATLIMRGVLSPFAHPLFTSMTGVGLGIAANARSAAGRILPPIVGYLLAVLLHGLWNASATVGGEALLWVYVVIMLPIFAFVVAVVLYQRRREQRVIGAELPAMAAAGWIAPSEARQLESLAGRRGWLTAVRVRRGPRVARLVAEYQAAITELAILRHRTNRGSLGPHSAEWHEELLSDVLEKRAIAVAAADAEAAAERGHPHHGGHRAEDHHEPRGRAPEQGGPHHPGPPPGGQYPGGAGPYRGGPPPGGQHPGGRYQGPPPAGPYQGGPAPDGQYRDDQYRDDQYPGDQGPGRAPRYRPGGGHGPVPPQGPPPEGYPGRPEAPPVPPPRQGPPD